MSLLPVQDSTALLLIDYQELLFHAMPEPVRAQKLRHTQIALRGAVALDLPVIATEQYPRGLGPTLGSLLGASPGLKPIEKQDFSAASVDAVMAALEASGASHVLVAGMETHICVLQTVVDLQARGLTCHVLADACLSRHTHNWRRGLALCERAGASVSTTEIALFQLLRTSDHDAFKAISRLIR